MENSNRTFYYAGIENRARCIGIDRINELVGCRGKIVTHQVAGCNHESSILKSRRIKRRIQIELKDSVIASSLPRTGPQSFIGTAPCIRSSGKIGVTAAAAADRLIDLAVAVKTTGAAIHMLIADRSAKIAGINQAC